MKSFTHLDESGNPSMVDVSNKAVTHRTATARTRMKLGDDIMQALNGNDIITKKGSVFHTARLAGIMAVKKTSELIPLCHPLSISKCSVDLNFNSENFLEILCTVKLDGKTGVEMEALTGASITALTVYDMCKSISHDITILETVLLEKTGGKSDIKHEK